MLAQIQSRMINEFNILERDQQGYSTTNGLFSIISTLGGLPGRKSLVLFSEGLAIPTAVQRLFTGVIAAANRVSVDTVARFQGNTTPFRGFTNAYVTLESKYGVAVF